MTVVVTDNCLLCRFTQCVTVCPVACFHGDQTMLYIEPSTCIECGSCIPLCPVGAIYDEIDLPVDKLHWKEINAQRAPGLPVVDMQQEPLPTAAARRVELGRG
jgi:ferredoxin